MSVNVRTVENGYEIVAGGPVRASPDSLVRAVVSREGAKFFRDIRAYSTYEQLHGVYTVSYVAGWGPMRHTVRLMLQPMGHTVHFDTLPGDSTAVHGRWDFTSAGMAVVHQHIAPSGWLQKLPLRGIIARRVSRALEDLSQVK